MCRRNDFASTTTHLVLHQVISASASMANLFHRARMPWILEHPFDSWLWDVPKIQISRQSLAQLGRTAVFLDHHAESELCSWLGTWTAERIFAPCCSRMCWDRWTMWCVWKKSMFIQRLPHHQWWERWLTWAGGSRFSSRERTRRSFFVHGAMRNPYVVCCLFAVVVGAGC